MFQVETLVALANAPARTGTLIQEALNAAGRNWIWFESWIQVSEHRARLITLATDVVMEDWPKAVRDVAILFSEE